MPLKDREKRIANSRRWHVANPLYKEQWRAKNLESAMLSTAKTRRRLNATH